MFWQSFGEGQINKCSLVQIASCGTAIASLLSQTLLPRSSNWLCWPRPWDEPSSSPLSSSLCHTIVYFCLPSSINLGNPHYWADVPFSMAFLESMSFGMQIWGVGVARRGFFSFFPSLFYNGPTLVLCSSRECLYWTLTERRARAWRQGQGDSAWVDEYGWRCSICSRCSV